MHLKLHAAIAEASDKARSVFGLDILSTSNPVRWHIPVNMLALVEHGLGLGLRAGVGGTLEGLSVWQAEAIRTPRSGDPIIWIEDKNKTKRVCIMNGGSVLTFHWDNGGWVKDIEITVTAQPDNHYDARFKGLSHEKRNRLLSGEWLPPDDESKDRPTE